jgi:hypothetical protein
MSTIIQADRAEWLAECRWVTDSGHEWLQVPLWAARQADQADKEHGGDGISVFSYVLNTRVFLEGDSDVAIFFDTFEITDTERAGLSSRVVVINGPAVIRDYPRWRA